MAYGFGVWKLLIALFFVTIYECREWLKNSHFVEIVNDLVVENAHVRDVLPCASLCEESATVNYFFFSQATQECYCSEQRDAFPESPSGQAGLLGTGLWVPQKDCSAYYGNGFTDHGVYTIEPSPCVLATVWCDMIDGGWTVIQRRLDGSEDFNRSWADYKFGFGDPISEYWLGLDIIHYLTQEPSELHIYMETFGDVTPVDGFIHYSFFSVADSTLLYQLDVSINDYNGSVSVGDSMFYSNGMKFTTFDEDNDLYSDNCAVFYDVGGWWMNACFYANLNGRYLSGQHDHYTEGVTWSHPWGYYYSLKKTVMKVRRKN